MLICADLQLTLGPMATETATTGESALIPRSEHRFTPGVLDRRPQRIALTTPACRNERLEQLVSDLLVGRR